MATVRGGLGMFGRPGHHLRARLRGPTWWVAAALACAAAGAVRLAYVLHGPVTIWTDSRAYMAEGSHPLVSAAIWTGTQPPLVPVLWHVTGSARCFAVVQASAAIVAWTFLALTVARRLPGRAAALVALTAILLFSLSPFVLQWDAQVLSESLSLSAIAVLVACGLAAADRYTHPRAFGIVVAATVFLLDRDEGLVLAASLAAGLVVAGSVELVRRHPGDAARLLGVGLLLLLVTAIGASLAATAHRNLTNAEDNLYVRVFPYPSRVAWFAAHGMPEAGRIDAIARAMAQHRPYEHAYAPPAAPAAPVLGPILSEPFWRPLDRWLGHHGEVAWAEFLLAHPLFDVSAPFHHPLLAYNSPPSLTFYRPGSGYPVPGVLWPPRVLLAPIGAVALVVLWARRQRRIAVLLTGFAVLGLVTALGAWLGDGQEIARHVLEGNLLLRLAALIAALTALAHLVSGTSTALRATRRPQRRDVGTSSTGATPSATDDARADVPRPLDVTSRGGRASPAGTPPSLGGPLRGRTRSV